MTDSVKLTAETPSDREIVVRRSFAAPRRLVFEAFTKPELVQRWLFGLDDWPMVICEIDFRIGGRYRYVWRNAEHGDMGMGGVYREIDAPARELSRADLSKSAAGRNQLPVRVVHTELFDQDWTGGETVVTTVFEEQDGKTTVTSTVLYSSKEARDNALKTPMLEGWGRAYDQLAALLAKGW